MIQYQLEQPVIFQQSPTWSRLIAGGIIGITAFTLIWASVFKIEESIPATGKLEPKGAVKEIQASVGGKVILDNQKRILEINSQVSEIDSKLTQAKETLKYQTIQSPVDGTIFELKAKSSGFVVNSSEPILKIVPADNLVAKVYITNRDIGFVKEGQKVDVRIDSFPFQEYGDIKGELIEIGSDALPPDQVYQYWRFPAKVKLDGQALLINSRQVPLQSGMSINANIKLRKRTVISIFTDFMVQKAESLKFVR
jgi:hemolysin D